MKLFLISKIGESIHLANTLGKEEHDHSFFIKDRQYKHIGDGMVKKVKDPGNLAMNSDLIIVDDVGLGAFVDKAKKIGRQVIGPGAAMERLSKDLGFRIDVLSALNIKVATDRTEGQAAIVGAWFNGEQFLKPIMVGTVYQRLAAGDLGPMTDGTGICVTNSLKSKLFNETLLKLQVFLKSVSFVGFINCICLVNNSTVHIKSIHPSLGFPGGLMMMSTFLSPIGEFLKNLYLRQVKTAPVNIKQIYLGVPIWVYATTAYPEVQVQTPNFIPIGLAKDTSYKHIRIDGLVGMTIGQGSSVKEASSMAYKAAKKVKSDNLFYRIDIEANNQFNRLREQGWWN